MTPDGEKQMLELLSEIRERLARIEADTLWFREREQRKIDNINSLSASMPRIRKS